MCSLGGAMSFLIFWLFVFLLPHCLFHIYFAFLSAWLSRWINECQFIWINSLSAIVQYAADRYTCTMSFLLIAVCSQYLLVPDACGLNMCVCVCVCVCVRVCIRDAFEGCVWDAAQVSVGVCWTTSLQGTGYQAEREAIMLITLHTPRQPSVQHNCWAHTHAHKHSHTCTSAYIYRQARAHTYKSSHLSLILSFSWFPPLLFEGLGHQFPFAFKKDCFIF